MKTFAAVSPRTYGRFQLTHQQGANVKVIDLIPVFSAAVRAALAMTQTKDTKEKGPGVFSSSSRPITSKTARYTHERKKSEQEIHVLTYCMDIYFYFSIVQI
jgi:hypothetical protein